VKYLLDCLAFFGRDVRGYEGGTVRRLIASIYCRRRLSFKHSTRVHLVGRIADHNIHRVTLNKFSKLILGNVRLNHLERAS
jgi:hypothetical protein